jgi:uncharacterized protein (TIGR01319 family)
MQASLLVDFGSTYTKVVAVDLGSAKVLAAVQTPTTAATDISVGLEKAVEQMRSETGLRLADFGARLACSSAAGGLRMVAIGLVPSLTTEAATRAALGAGARLVRTFSQRLTASEVCDIEALLPDIILLAGGTNGGDSQSITANARALASSPLACPIVVAGNTKARDDVLEVLEGGGKHAVAAENVMPELNSLNVEPARSVIREVFARHIVHANGIDRANRFLDDVIMPTPMAVLEAAKLLSDGVGNAKGVGDLVVVDVGGATTDVHSVAAGEPAATNVIVNGLPEPRAKRTVEGDLGLRMNAPSILARAATLTCLPDGLRDELQSEGVASWATLVSERVSLMPSTDEEASCDIALARAAVHLAVERHAGALTSVYTPRGPKDVQRGKDLSPVEMVIGTGGIFRGRSLASASILSEAAASERDATSLRPRQPTYYVDRDYMLFVGGLLAGIAPEVGRAVLDRSLVLVET